VIAALFAAGITLAGHLGDRGGVGVEVPKVRPSSGDGERQATRHAEHRPHRRQHPYALRGLVICGLCERRMQRYWVNGAPYYRCRLPAQYALAKRVEHPLNVNLCEDAVIGRSREGRLRAPRQEPRSIGIPRVSEGRGLPMGHGSGITLTTGFVLGGRHYRATLRRCARRGCRPCVH
jgi:hypothetical protein